MSSWIRATEREGGGRGRERWWCFHCGLWIVATDKTLLYLHKSGEACLLRNSRCSSRGELLLWLSASDVGFFSAGRPIRSVSSWPFLIDFPVFIWKNKLTANREREHLRGKAVVPVGENRKKSGETQWCQTFKQSNLFQRLLRRHPHGQSWTLVCFYSPISDHLCSFSL